MYLEPLQNLLPTAECRSWSSEKPSLQSIPKKNHESEKGNHPTWGDKSNSQGETLSNFQEKQHLYTLNYGELTFTCIGEGRSTIDLIICNENLKEQNIGLCIDEFTEISTGAPNRGHYRGRRST